MGLVLAGACGGDSDVECKLGELTGAWRFHYVELDGSCGPISDETAVLGGAGNGACVYYAEDTSADQCETTLDFECPTTDNDGSQRWVMVLEQVADDRIEGSATVQVEHAVYGACRSTYDVTVTAL
jgi:hypothetical protein